jgi:acyl-CoA dehydrogenase
MRGSPVLRARWIPKVVAGDVVAAFALTEPEAGSDLAGIATTARREGDEYVLDGHKIFISNAGVAGFYTVFAVTGEGKRRLSAFAVPAPCEGLTTTPMHVLGGHPIGELRFAGVRVPADARIGEEGDGLGIALQVLHAFRPTVGAAAVGFAQRALDETVAHVKSRVQFGQPLAAQQAVQLAVADMACEIDAARLLVHRAAAVAESGADRGEVARTGSMAKLVATENAQRVIDRAVQLHGGRGVLVGSIVARLYEDVRALRIYEGASDVQRLLIAREILRPGSEPR